MKYFDLYFVNHRTITRVFFPKLLFLMTTSWIAAIQWLIEIQQFKDFMKKPRCPFLSAKFLESILKVEKSLLSSFSKLYFMDTITLIAARRCSFWSPQCLESAEKQKQHTFSFSFFWLRNWSMFHLGLFGEMFLSNTVKSIAPTRCSIEKKQACPTSYVWYYSKELIVTGYCFSNNFSMRPFSNRISVTPPVGLQPSTAYLQWCKIEVIVNSCNVFFWSLVPIKWSKSR